MWDGIIIGGGLSGLITGIRAAARGKRVLMVTAGASTLHYASGVFDFGGVAQLKNSTKHPYSLIGEAALQQSFDYFLSVSKFYTGNWAEQKTFLTPFGETGKGDLIPMGLDATPLTFAHRIIVISPWGLKDFYPDIVSATLRRTYPKATVSLTKLRVERFKSWYEQGKSILGTAYGDFWQSKDGIATLRRILKGIVCETDIKNGGNQTVVVFPSLTSAFSPEIQQVLGESLIPVVEITSFPPSSFGIYLERFLQRRFRELGGEIFSNAKAVNTKKDGQVCRELVVQSAGKLLHLKARTFVLASGGLLGGGVRVYPKGVAEEVFGFPIDTLEEWSKEDFFGVQPYASLGVEVDAKLHPIDPANGEVLLKNVLVVGRSIGNWDLWSDRCGGGVAIASGCLAGSAI